MQSISIRPALNRHLADIPAIELAGATLFSEQDLPHDIRHKVTADADLHTALQNDRLWVAVQEGEKTVGFAMADVVDNQGYLVEVDVRPEFGRQGTGTELVRAVIRWARACGFQSLLLVTFRHLAWNAPFYEKLGFSIIEPVEHGPELAALIEEERQAGIDVTKRVGMRMEL